MEDLFSQFTFLSNIALTDKSFDPSSIEDLTKLFELDSYKAWAALELESNQELEETENELRKTEEYLESDIENAMREFYKFEEEMDLEAERELKSLMKIGDSVWNLGKFMENRAAIVANRYVEAAMKSAGDTMKSAGDTMRSAWNGVSNKKVHPS